MLALPEIYCPENTSAVFIWMFNVQLNCTCLHLLIDMLRTDEAKTGMLTREKCNFHACAFAVHTLLTTNTPLGAALTCTTQNNFQLSWCKITSRTIKNFYIRNSKMTYATTRDIKDPAKHFLTNFWRQSERNERKKAWAKTKKVWREKRCTRNMT